MVASGGGPACQRCGTPLRWVPEWNAWGCDRCRVSYPVVPAVAQPQPIAAAAMPMAPPRASGGSKQWIFFALGGAVLIAGAIVIIVLATGGKKGGMGSAKELVQAAIDRAAKGDVDGLIALGGGDSLLAQLDCKDPKDKDEMRDEFTKRAREHAVDRTKAWKDVAATIVSVEAHGDPDVMKAGTDEHGCTAKTDFTSQDYRAKVKVKAKDGDVDDELTFGLIETGGRFYLEDMPEQPPSGDMAQLTKMKDAMCACKDSACIDKAQKDFAPVMTAMGEKYKGDAKPTEDMMKVGEEMAECMSKAMGAGSPSQEDPPPPPPEHADIDRSSPDAIAAQATAAASAGDGDALLALTGGADFQNAMFDCPNGNDDTVATIKSAQQHTADNWKGGAASVASMAPAQHQTVHAGDALGSCKVKRDVEVDACDITLAFTAGGQARTMKGTIVVAQLDGQWYLVEFPREPAR